VHFTIIVTLDTYSHIPPNTQKEAVKEMEDMIDCSLLRHL